MSSKHCAWCGDPPNEYGSHGICLDHARTLRQRRQATRTSPQKNMEPLFWEFVVDPVRLHSNEGQIAMQSIVITGNGSSIPYSDEKCFHEYVEDRAVSIPDAIAVVEEDTRLTYAQLNTHANQLAHHLHMLNMVPGTLVGVYLEHSASLVVAMLGVIKAGGIYLPIDTHQGQLIEHARPKLILTTQPLADALPLDLLVLCLDTYDSLIASEPEHNPKFPVSANDPMLSTPDGLLSHAVVGKIMSKDESVLYTIDATSWVIFSSLLSGTTLSFQTEHMPVEQG